MSKFQVEVYCYDFKKKLVAKIDAGQLTPEQIEEGGFDDAKACRSEILKAVEAGKGKKVALTIKQILISLTNITETVPLLTLTPDIA